jgi:hypothetical protein
MRPKGIPLRTPFWHETVLWKTVIGMKRITWGSANMCVGSDVAKMRPTGYPPKDSLWDETVSFKTAIGLKWIIWGVRKNCFGSYRSNMGPKGVPPRTPYGMKPFSSKL